jgi:hypothetical protein
MSTESKKVERCPICMDDIGETNKAKTACGHDFCLTCILQCVKKKETCPLCRKDLVKKEHIEEEHSMMINEASRIILDEVDIFDLDRQIKSAMPFGSKSVKSVMQMFALNVVHSVLFNQNPDIVHESWEDLNPDSDDDEEESDEEREEERDREENSSREVDCTLGDSLIVS